MKTGCQSVLLIDDESIVVSSAKRILEKKGYHVLTAMSGKEALTVFREHKRVVDIILLDLSMPDMDGEETLEKLLEIDAGAKVILFSGYARDIDIDPLFEKGALDHIQKPFDIQALIEKINKAIS